MRFSSRRVHDGLGSTARRGWSPLLDGPQGDDVATANELILAGYNTAR